MTHPGPLKTRVVITIAAFCAATGLAHADGTPFLAEYAVHEVQLRKQYFTNVRSKISILGYNDSTRDGGLTHRITYTTIADGNSCRATFDTHRLIEDTKHHGGIMWSKDEAYYLEQQPDFTYELSERKSLKHGRARVDNSIVGSYIFAPFSMTGGLSLSTHVEVMMRQSKSLYSPFEIESATRVRRNGYDAVRIVTSSGFGQSESTTTTYLDAGNHMAFREYESDSLLDIRSRAYIPIKQAGELTYAPGPDGYPVPKEYKQWYVYPDGRQVPRLEVTWLEFSPYTPTADDFDLEKQFGVTPPVEPPPAEPPVPEELSWRGLYAVAAVVALLAGWGVAVVRRRRRLATTAA